MTGASGSDAQSTSAPAEVKPGAEPWNPPLTRGGLLKTGAAVAAAGGAATLARSSPAARAAANGGSKYKGAQFRGFVRYGTTAEVVDLEMTVWPIPDRQILIRTEATQACYTFSRGQIATTAVTNAGVAGHGGVGIVVAKGSGVRRCNVGERVLVAVTPQCGVCYNCLLGRADTCQRLESDAVNGLVTQGGEPVPWMQMKDGTPVRGGRGFCELMLVEEDWAVPLVTEHSSTLQQLAEVSLLSCPGGTGLGMSASYTPPFPGADVVVIGCGPIGLSAINGAAIHGAGQIIAVDQIKYRREIALEVGATMAIDPTGKEATLPAEIRELCKGRTPRFDQGGRGWGTIGGFVGRGPDFIYEATSAEVADPIVEPQPQPAGIGVQHAWSLCPTYGTITACGLPGGNITIPTGNFTNSGKKLRSAQYGGTQLMRDIPRFVTLLERGLYRGDKIATKLFSLSQAYDCMRAAAYRTTVSAHVVYDVSKPLGKQ